MTATRSRTRRKGPTSVGARPPIDFATSFATTFVNRGNPPPRRGNRIASEDEPRRGWLIVRAILVGTAFLALVVDQAYRPDLSRQREVLITQIAEATSRVDRARKEIEYTATERSHIARNGVPNEQKSRWTGEPYQSTEHCLYDYDRRIGHLQECLDQVLAQAEGYSAGLQSIDAGGGRRVPFANQLLAHLRKELGR